MENPSPNMSSDALRTTIYSTIQALGRGFDVTSDIRLLYCKGTPGSRLVKLDEENTKDLQLSRSLVIPDVPVDVDCLSGERTVKSTPVYTFDEMVEFFSSLAGVSGCSPLGSFNAMFNFTGSRHIDAAATKSLAMVGCFIYLCTVKLVKSELELKEEVKRTVPYSWDPTSLASFIETYGTHIVTSATIGGRDVVYIRQHQSSTLSQLDIENYLKEIGDERFHDSRNQSSSVQLNYKDKDVTVIFRRRGGDDLEQSHKYGQILFSSHLMW